MPQGWQDSGQIAASFNFDLDLWGKNRAALAAATSEQHAARIDVRQAELLLSTGIASAYVDLALLFAIRDVRQAELTIRENSRKLVSDRVGQGLDNRGSLAQAEAQAASARAALTEAEQAIALRRHQLAMLVGAGPDRGLAITPPPLAAVPVRGLPQGVTTDLICRRPDVVAARERVEAAASRIKVARADFFPAINLSALVGFQSLGLANLLSGASTLGKSVPRSRCRSFAAERFPDSTAALARLTTKPSPHTTAACWRPTRKPPMPLPRSKRSPGAGRDHQATKCSPM